MELTETMIRGLFSEKDYADGMDLFESDRIYRLEKESDFDTETVTTRLYAERGFFTVSVVYREPEFTFSCECSAFKKKKSCCHCAALLITYQKQQEAARRRGSDYDADMLLRSYADAMPQKTETEEGAVPEGSVSVQPCLHFGRIGSAYNYKEQRFPDITLTIGRERQYVVRNMGEFLNRFERQETFQYGKKLVLTHTMETLDERSRALVGILSDCADAGDAYALSGIGGSKDALIFSGFFFSRFFDLYEGGTVSTDDDQTLRLQSGDPEIVLKLRKSGKGVTVQYRKCAAFGDSKAYYIVTGDTMYRCGDDFRKAMLPLLAGKESVLYFSAEDFTGFCSLVYPRIRKYVTLLDPDGLLEQFCPDECTPRFLLDYNRERIRLTAQLSFRYHDTFVTAGTPSEMTPTIRRDPAAETEAERLLSSCMAVQPDHTYAISREESIYAFLTEKIPALQAAGEVLISDSLSSLRVSAEAVSVGLSVSEGLLHLDFNTGEFPPAELEALYQSLILRKKYHRLRDGRYLTLNGTDEAGLAQLAQALHMSQLSPKDIESGSAAVPLYRSFYLDSLLSGEAGLRVYRDNTLRAMIRQFKTVEESDYAVPECMKNVLRPYQETGFRWLKTLDGCGFGGILADEMGLGKTVEMIAYLLTVRRETVGLPSLIACPASLVYNWADEFRRFAPEMKTRLIIGTVQEREEQLAAASEGDDDVLITSYDLLKRDRERYPGMEFYCFVLDEGQMVKNQTTLGSQSVKGISCKQRFVMTGTPIENRLSELWNLFDFLMPGYLFTQTRFVEKLEKPIIKNGSAEAREQLKKLVAPFLLRRLKKDVLKELPPKIEETRVVSLSEEERAVYAASVLAAKGLLSDENGEKNGKFRFLAALTRLREICCAPGLCYENYTGETSKLDACIELCRGMTENGHQILLFSQFTSMLDLLRAALTGAGITSFTLQGSTPKEERAALVRSFNEGGAQVFLISLKAGGTGLNLTAADVVIHYDPWWNQAAQDQATDRAHRIGQKSCVQVYRLIAKDTIEERILALQEKKASLLDSVSDGNDESILSLSREELLALLD